MACNPKRKKVEVMADCAACCHLWSYLLTYLPLEPKAEGREEPAEAWTLIVSIAIVSTAIVSTYNRGLDGYARRVGGCGIGDFEAGTRGLPQPPAAASTRRPP